jgi:hypothetical protein
MTRLFFLTLLLFGIGGCGRTADFNSDTATNSSGKLQFITVTKSHFVAGDYPDSGHYQTVVRTLNKPDFYAQNDALEDENNYSLYENNKHTEESIIVIEKSNNEIESDVMLLLDLSGSIIDSGCNIEGTTCNKLTKAAHAFVNNIIQNGNFKIAIYYFNAKSEITPLTRQTEYPTSNLVILNDAIDKLKDSNFVQQYLKGYDNSTNLYGAVKQSGDKICSWIECDNENNFKMGSVVVFTDGRDTANLVSKKEMIKSIKDDIQYYTIGIGDADNKTLIEISGKERHFSSDAENVENAFSDTYNYILYNSSFYRINYCPSTRNGTVRIKIFFNDKDHNIKTYTQEDKISINNSDFRCDI